LGIQTHPPSLKTGTSPYIAPELVTDYRKHAPKYLVTYTADIYSFGIVLWELLHAPMPTHPLRWDPYRILVECKYNNYRSTIDPSVPPKIAAIIRQCWATNPADRPDLHELSSELAVLAAEFAAQPARTSAAAAADQLRTWRSRQLSHSSML
jgi:serine/threonine protein kinase